MDTSLRPKSPLLPPFSIRDLNGPEVPPAVIQITGGQYTSALKSQPDACLQYVDNTDGDIITVGSTLELQQRLDEPVDESRHHNHHFLTPSKQPREEDLIHIFDIKQSSANLAIWREHEAYTSKALRQPRRLQPATPSTAPAASTNQSRFHTATSSPLHDAASARSPISASSDHELAPALTPMPPTQQATTSQVDLAFSGLLETLQSQLVPLADILDATADGLRRAAEKTAEADATAAEDVLTGFKGIFAELGAMGREFLSSLDAEFQKTRNTTSSPLPHDPPAAEPSNPDTNNTLHHVQTKVDPAWKRVSFVDSQVNIPPKQKTVPIANRTPHASSADFFMQRGALVGDARAHDDCTNLSQTKKATEPTGNRPYSYLDKVPKAVLTWPPPPPPTVSSKGLSHNNSVFSLNSILDAETTDPDFSVRYPPLMSVRKSKSVGGLHAKTKTDQIGSSALHTMSALTRYPSIPQFEEQNRAKVASALHPKESESLAIHPLNNGSAHSHTSPSSGADTISPTIEKKSKQQKPASGVALDDKTKASRPVRKIPGSWPESHSHDWFGPKPFLDGISLPTGCYHAHDLSARVSSPGIESYYRAPIFPRRNQTVSGTNPAARLNGPFDPLASLPSLRPRAQKSQPNLMEPQPKPKPDEQKPKTEVPNRLPQRGHTVHHTDRGRAPPATAPSLALRPTLWDGYVQHGLNHAKSFDQSFSSGNRGPNARQSTPPGAASRDGVLADKPKASNMGCGNCLKARRKCDGQRPLCDRCARLGSQCFYLFDSQQDGEMVDQEPVREHPLSVPSNPITRNISPAESLPAMGFPGFQSWTIRETQEVANPVRLAQPEPFLGYNNPPHPVMTLATSSSARRVEGPVPPRHSPPSAATAIESCVQTLKDMGYGKSDANELARLNVYAGAAAGNVEDAIEMIEEDREAVRHYAEGEDLEDFRSQGDDDLTGPGEIRL